MHPELFEIPFVHLTIKSYGLMMVIGFLVGLWLITRLSRSFTAESKFVSNAALYSLIAGVVGARLFYVIHHFSKFRGNLFSVFAVWKGGLELLGGVILAVIVIFLYLRHHKLPVRQFFDLLVIAFMLALAFGRIGCFLNGCCYGRPANVPWAVRFPYGSDAYCSQVYYNPDRNRPEPHLKLPAEYSIYNTNINGIAGWELKPYADLTAAQKEMVDNGLYRCLPVHPAQLYSSAAAVFSSLLLYLFWRRGQKAAKAGNTKKLFIKPGSTFALGLTIYGISRFFLEFIRDDNPFGFDGLTVSQNISIFLLIPAGIILMAVFQKINTGLKK